MGRFIYARGRYLVGEKYVYENRFIDIDIYAVARMIWAGEQVDTDVMAQVKVALYRYFSHVRIERDKYVCDLASGKEISVSSRVFTALQENLEESEHWCTGNVQTRYGTGSSCDRRGISPIFVTIKKAPVFYRCLCTYSFSNRAATQLFFSKCFL